MTFIRFPGLGLLVLMAGSSLFAQTTAVEFNSRAITKANGGDPRGSIADYTKAITLDPSFVSAYTNRGSAYAEFGENTKAMADFDHAISLKPDDWNAFSYRGQLKQKLGDLDGAIADFSRVIEIVPWSDEYWKRALVRMIKGQLRAACADYTQLIWQDGGPNAGLFQLRGMVRHMSGNSPGALADFEAGLAIAKDNDDRAAIQIARYLVLRQLNRPEAGPELTKSADSWPEDWNKTLAHFLLGEVPEADFLEVAPGEDKEAQRNQCITHYYAGMRHLLAGETETALEYFKKSVATSAVWDNEYAWAQGEIFLLTRP
jgi:tetratricopeptide (TPR) repeat protein